MIGPELEGPSLVADLLPTGAPQDSTWRRISSRLSIGLATVLVVTTVCGFLGSRWWAFDVLANLRLQQALALIVLTGGLGVLGPRWAAGLAAAGAVANLVLVVPLLIGSGPAAVAPGAATLDVTFFNVKIRAADTDSAIAYLRERDDDLVVLAAGTRGWVDALEAADLGLTVIEGPRRGSTSELIVLARDPTVTTTLPRSEEGSRTALVEAVLDLGGERIRVLGTHPVSPLTPARAEQRDAHFAWIADWARQSADPVVVGGDLNATSWSAALRSLLRDGGLVDSQRAHGTLPSWPAPWGPLGLTLDHVLHSPDLVVLERQVGPSFGSDHRAVHARVAHAMPSS